MLPYDTWPFNDDVSTDLIIRASDHFDFRVHKIILATASPVFDSILSLPHVPPEYAADEDYVDGIPVLSLTEPSTVVDIFLRWCYPIKMPPSLLYDISMLNLPLYHAGKKYEADVVIQHAVDILARRCKEKRSCVKAYAIACHLGLSAEAHSAATTSLSYDAEYYITQTRCDELKLISAASFFNLIDYHRRCREEVQRMLCSPLFWVNREQDFAPMFERDDRESRCCAEAQNRAWIGIAVNDDDDELPRVVHGVHYSAKQWAMDYLADLSRLLDDDRIRIRDAVRDPQAASRAVQKASECPSCREHALECIISFTQAAEEAVSYAICSVSLKIDP